LKTDNRIGIFKAEFDVQSTFEGDNNVLLQQVIFSSCCPSFMHVSKRQSKLGSVVPNLILLMQVSKALYAEFLGTQKKKKPFKGLGLEHLNGPSPVIPGSLTSGVLRSSKFQVNNFNSVCH
jgi:acyl-CoA oxidase